METTQGKNVKVYTSFGLAHATVVREMLEKIGVPVTLKYDSVDYLPGKKVDVYHGVDLLVPEERGDEVRTLLMAEPPAGEIFFVPTGV